MNHLKYVHSYFEVSLDLSSQLCLSPLPHQTNIPRLHSFHSIHKAKRPRHRYKSQPPLLYRWIVHSNQFVRLLNIKLLIYQMFYLLRYDAISRHLSLSNYWLYFHRNLVSSKERIRSTCFLCNQSKYYSLINNDLKR